MRHEIWKLQEDFRREYYLEVYENVKLMPEFSKKVHYLQGIIKTNASEWSGGHSATNLEESIKRDVAIEILGVVANMLVWDEVKRNNKEVA
jgi:hypothetical protein